MIQLWYYWHQAEVLGPFSGEQLVALAAAGDILPDDIVWKEGVERGVPAQQVQHLFAAPSPSILPTVSSEAAPAASPSPAEPAQEKSETATPAAPPVQEPVKPTWESGRAATGGKGRAVAGKGTVIIGQDGKNVKFRMKCTTCNHEDSSWQSMTITRGTSRRTYYCPKCRKRCSVEINGYIS